MNKEIKVGSIVKASVDEPVKVSAIGKVDSIKNNTLTITKGIMSISDGEYAILKEKYDDLEGEVNEYTLISSGIEFDKLYDLLGRELFHND